VARPLHILRAAGRGELHPGACAWRLVCLAGYRGAARRVDRDITRDAALVAAGCKFRGGNVRICRSQFLEVLDHTAL